MPLNIVLFLYNSDRSGAFEIELGAIQALRRQLEDGVERNNKLRAAMEAQLKISGDKQPEQSSATATSAFFQPLSYFNMQGFFYFSFSPNFNLTPFVV